MEISRMGANPDAEFLPLHRKMGPFDPRLPGPLRLELELDGVVVRAARVELGFCHRGVEKALELHSWETAIPYADRVDPENALYGELAYCLAVEQICGVSAPERAGRARMILAELSRISSHLRTLAKFCEVLELDAFAHYLLKDRERILDLFELVSGARFTLGYLRLGGVAYDITDGFLEKTRETCEELKRHMPEYEALMTRNRVFYQSLVDHGVLGLSVIHRFGVTGVNARSSGTLFDVRRDQPYLEYSEYAPTVFAGHQGLGSVGDCYHRFVHRLLELKESVRLIEELEKDFPKGDFRLESFRREPHIPNGEAYVRVETPRGLMGCHVISEGAFSPARVQYQTPSSAVVDCLSTALIGIDIDLVPLFLASLDISVTEVDR